VSDSRLVCSRDGIPVTTCRGDAWRHALGGKTGAIPKRKRHRPVPVLRTDYDRAFAWDTPVAEARWLLANFRELERQVAGEGDMIFR
jgi:hypothetical protein